MLSTLRKAYRRGFHAGLARPVIMGIGGRHGLKAIVRPLNPFNNTFSPRWRPLLALAWEIGEHDGSMQRLTAGRFYA